MPTQTDPRSRVAGALFDVVREKFGAAAASRWMFSGHPGLRTSPIEALKAGRVDDVKRAILNLTSLTHGAERHVEENTEAGRR